MSAALPSKTLLVAVALSGLLLVVLVSFSLANDSEGTGTKDGSRCQALPEPPAAATFIQAQRDRDVEKASLVTSPLFRAELERRGRGAEWPLFGLWVEAAPKLVFSYAGAVKDGNGFTYALYTARPRVIEGPDAPTTLWRVDLDPEGQVIWAEWARLFAQPSIEVICDSAALSHNSLSALSLARLGSGLGHAWALSRLGAQSQVVLGIRSAAGDAYLALHPVSDEPSRIAFAQVDTTGELGPSYWSFGQPLPALDAEGHGMPPRPLGFSQLSELTDSDLKILQEYLDALAWSPPEAGSAR